MSLPIRVRLTAWYAALLAATIIALSTFLVLQLRADLRAAVDEEARLSSVELTRAVIGDAREDIADPDDAADEVQDFREAARAVLSSSGAGAQLLDESGRVLLHYGTVVGSAPLVSDAVRAAALAGPPLTFTVHLGEDGQPYRVRVSSFRQRGEGRALVLIESLQPVEDAVARVLLLLLVAGPAALVLTSLAAYWLAYKALRPVQRITGDAREIGIDRLHERVAVPDSDDETGRLAVTLNAMLDRIEDGVREKHRLVADASHELRTPLAVMRTELDVTLRSEELSPAARDVLDSAREEVDRMTRTVDNLLTLAQVDEGRLELLTVPVDLHQIAAEAAGSLHALAAAKGVTVQVGGEHWRAQADPQRLHLALTNLVENAIKFSPSGGTVRVTTWDRGDDVGLTVADDGPGIPADDLEHLFDRFYRADSARRREADGSGLGLAICRGVALAHGGRIWVDSEPGVGSAFSVALPSWRFLERGTQPTSTTEGTTKDADDDGGRSAR